MGFFTKKKQTLSFPFDDQQNTACIVCCHILEGHPILYVSHDEDDGMWQFLCGSNHNIEDASIVSLLDRKSTRLNSSHTDSSRMPSSA